MEHHGQTLEGLEMIARYLFTNNVSLVNDQTALSHGSLTVMAIRSGPQIGLATAP